MGGDREGFVSGGKAVNDQEKPEVQRLILPCPHWHPEAKEATDSLGLW